MLKATSLEQLENKPTIGKQAVLAGELPWGFLESVVDLYQLVLTSRYLW